ncbi:MAG: hypothetical protein ASARMPRED_003175 [Alectoria sarmentosa]|nr:MAG: hypothetical protein ASARMPRED_003175 [Alectoria sarmentosa]
MDALGHCYEGEMAQDRKKPLYQGAAKSSVGKGQIDATGHMRISELQSKVGTSRDAVMANLRLLGEARQRLTSSSKDISVRYGKEKLALGDILPISDDLNRLWQGKAEKPVANPEEINSILIQRDELCKERDASIQLMKAAQQERDSVRKEWDRYLEQMNAVQKERDLLLRERDCCRKESELLKQERDQLRKENAQCHQQLLIEQEKAAKKSTGINMVPQGVWEETERKRNKLLALSTRYRQERDDARRECHSQSIERDQYQTRVGKLEAEVKEAGMQLSSSKALSNTYLSQYNETFNNERAARRKAEQSNTELIALRRTLKQERQAFDIQLDGLETAQLATATERDQIRSQLTNVQAVNGKERGLELRRQRTTLQGTYTTQLQGLRRSLESQHDLLVRNLTQGWEQEKARLVASATADRDAISDMALTARRMEKSHSATLKIHLNILEQSREATARNEDMSRDLVIAVAVSRASYNRLHNAFVKRGRTISNGIDRIQEFENQLTGLQDCVTTSASESSGLREKLHGKEKELDELSIANDANILSLRDIQSVHAVCEDNQRLQLGHINRQTFFHDSSEVTQSLSVKGKVLRGEQSGRGVEVCFCVLPESNELLCVIRRFGDAFTVWHSKLEDCSTFSYHWHRWLCLDGEGQGQPIYIRLMNAGESEAWLRKYLP